MDLSEIARNKKIKWRFWIFFCLAVVFYIWMKWYLFPLKSQEIVQFEMAKNPQTAAALIQHWSQNAKLNQFIKSIYVDYFFIVVYTLAIASGCRFVASLTKNDILIKAGIFFSYFIIVAALFDIIENIAMMKGIQQTFTPSNVNVVYKMAISKFSIIIITLFFIAICFMYWLLGLIKHQEKAWK